uniref:Uncharacterized protein n=1 Tax=Favella ehrenbergii TaxID=182087 RepID=A0A7S3MRI0_9SPIT|mmetsp:Transcript_9778/g.12071  ORF Transcript_9778/g.12071 Transcript_9778/m.12071 type:complete len:226 (+) Transcript_9778:38-715(+)
MIASYSRFDRDLKVLIRVSDAWNLLSRLVGRLQDGAYATKAFLPRTDFLLDSLPLLQLDLAQHVVLDHNHLVHLVDLRVNDFVLDSIDCPQLDLLLVDVEFLGKVRVAVVGFVCVKRANLHVGLLDDELLFSEALVAHQVLIIAELGLEFGSARRSEEVEEAEDLRVLVSELLNGRQVQKLSEVDHINGLDGEDDAAAGVVFSASECVFGVVEFQVAVDNVEGGA